MEDLRHKFKNLGLHSVGSRIIKDLRASEGVVGCCRPSGFWEGHLKSGI